jgi:hypothetical protein
LLAIAAFWALALAAKRFALRHTWHLERAIVYVMGSLAAFWSLERVAALFA